MKKTVFIVLALFALFSLFSMRGFLFSGNEYYSKNFFANFPLLGIQRNKTGTDGFITTKALCPEDPPNLVGAIKVELPPKITLKDVEEKVGFDLQNGGRYKPPNCISQHKVAVIIPFRNRHQHLIYWLYFLHPILKRQQLDYGVYVINQHGERIFNRGKLMNAGYIEALKKYDYKCFVFSDVDMIPMNDRNIHKCFDKPRHLSAAVDIFGFKLPYNTIFGGVSSLSKDQFLKVNGFSNTFWGWGGEDDDMFNRITHRGMKLSRPDLLTGRYKMIKHVRDLHNERNPENPKKLLQTSETMDKDGLNSLDYNVTGIVKNKLYTFITVDVFAPQSLNVTEKPPGIE